MKAFRWPLTFVITALGLLAVVSQANAQSTGWGNICDPATFGYGVPRAGGTYPSASYMQFCGNWSTPYDILDGDYGDRFPCAQNYRLTYTTDQAQPGSAPFTPRLAIVNYPPSDEPHLLRFLVYEDNRSGGFHDNTRVVVRVWNENLTIKNQYNLVLGDWPRQEHGYWWFLFYYPYDVYYIHLPITVSSTGLTHVQIMPFTTQPNYENWIDMRLSSIQIGPLDVVSNLYHCQIGGDVPVPPPPPPSSTPGGPTITPSSTPLPTATPGGPTLTPSPVPSATRTPYPTSEPIASPAPSRTATPIAFKTLLPEPYATPMAIPTLANVVWPTIVLPTLAPAMPVVTVEAVVTQQASYEEMEEQVVAVVTRWASNLEPAWASFEMTSTEGFSTTAESLNVGLAYAGYPIRFARSIGLISPNTAPFWFVVMGAVAVVLLTHITKFAIAIIATVLNFIKTLWEAIPFN